MQRAYIYIDGFNLYNRSLKGTPHKWLDPAKPVRHMLPNAEITRVKYFTARMSARPDDPGQTVRQQTYLRALAAQPEIEIFYGHFLSHPVSALNLEPPPKWVKFLKTEEKGSDVNIATQLLCDAYERRFDVAAVVSSDSDLVMPIEVVTHPLGLPVGVLSPRDPVPVKLREVATFVRVIRHGVLAASQLPTTLTDSTGTVHKPRAW